VSEAEAEVIIDISDTGRGIPADIKEKLFDRFYQVDSLGAPSKPGFGIGLYLVKHFTEQHKGTITYQSELDKGTTFTVTLLKGKEHLSSYTIAGDSTEAFLLQEIAQLEVPALQPATDVQEMADMEETPNHLADIISEKKSILVTDDDAEIRKYIAKVFKEEFLVYQAESGEEGVKLAKEYLPDIIISDIKMEGISGIEFCKTIKEDPALSHIPVILLTGETSGAVKLEGVEGGADDYITKPFDKELLIARVSNLLKSRNSLQKYFYNEITLSQNNIKISAEYKEFLERCIQVVEEHLYDDNFTVKSLASEIGMSHSALYKKVKSVSGQSPNAFIRFIRLRKAAELFINSDLNVNEVAVQVGINHTKYFREQFNKLFGINPSEYIKKFRKPFNNKFNVNKGLAPAKSQP
jgi:DNA-binding response OmpR family regulator